MFYPRSDITERSEVWHSVASLGEPMNSACNGRLAIDVEKWRIESSALSSIKVTVKQPKKSNGQSITLCKPMLIGLAI